MGIFSSRKKDELDKLIEENDELKNTLHTFVQKHTSLSELEAKLEQSRKMWDKLNSDLDVLKNNIGGYESELAQKQELLNNINYSVNDLEERKSLLEASISSLNRIS